MKTRHLSLLLVAVAAAVLVGAPSAAEVARRAGRPGLHRGPWYARPLAASPGGQTDGHLQSCDTCLPTDPCWAYCGGAGTGGTTAGSTSTTSTAGSTSSTSSGSGSSTAGTSSGTPSTAGSTAGTTSSAGSSGGTTSSSGSSAGATSGTDAGTSAGTTSTTAGSNAGTTSTAGSSAGNPNPPVPDPTITVDLVGLIDPVNDRRLMIGQRLRADVKGVPAGANATYTWSVNKARPFNQFNPAEPEGKVKPFSPPNEATIHCFFARDARDVVVTCAVHLTNPDKTLLGSSDKFEVQIPTLYHDKQSIGVGMVGTEDEDENSPTYTHVTPDDVNPNFFGLYGATYPRAKQPWGIFYDAWVQDRSGYNPLGTFTFLQLVTDESKYTNLAGQTAYAQPKRGVSLDYGFPYLNLPFKPAGQHYYQGNPLWHIFLDRPHVKPLNLPTLKQEYKAITYDARFKMYVVYKGAYNQAGDGDVVPIRLVPWDFVSTATYNKSTIKWVVANAPNNTIKPSEDYPDFPKWPEWHQVIRGN